MAKRNNVVVEPDDVLGAPPQEGETSSESGNPENLVQIKESELSGILSKIADLEQKISYFSDPNKPFSESEYSEKPRQYKVHFVDNKIVVKIVRAFEDPLNKVLMYELETEDKQRKIVKGLDYVNNIVGTFEWAEFVSVDQKKHVVSQGIVNVSPITTHDYAQYANPTGPTTKKVLEVVSYTRVFKLKLKDGRVVSLPEDVLN